MLDKAQDLLQHERVKQFTDIRNVGLYVFALLVIATTWSGVHTVEDNFTLQQKINRIAEENKVLQLQNENAALQNKYLDSEQYLDLSARRQFGLAAPGETLITIPKDVAMKYVSAQPQQAAGAAATTAKTQPKYIQNFEAWRDLLMGRGLNASIDKTDQTN